MPKMLANLNLTGNEIQNFIIQNLAVAPTGAKGKVYFNTTDNKLYAHDGTSWIDMTLVFSNKSILDAMTASFTTALKTKLDSIASGANNYVHPSTHPASMITGLSNVATSGSYADLTLRPTLGTASSKDTGTSSGQIPILGTGGKLDTSVLPALAISDTFVVANQTAMLALTAEVGDIAVRTDQNKSYILKASPASTLANWQELLTPTQAVSSVNGKTGAVTVTKSDVGLGNVDNVKQASKTEFDTHVADQDSHVDITQKIYWNGKANASQQLIGNGTATTFTLSNGLQTAVGSVTVREMSSGEIVYPDVSISPNGEVTIQFGSAPSNNQYGVTFIGK